MLFILKNRRIFLRYVPLAFLAAGLNAYSQANLAAPSDTTEMVRAIVPTSNDIEFGDQLAEQRVVVPAPVAKLVGELVNTEYSRYMQSCHGEDCKISKNSFLGPIFKLKTPVNADLYVVTTENPLGFVNSYYFILTSGDGISKRPGVIDGRWLD